MSDINKISEKVVTLESRAEKTDSEIKDLKKTVLDIECSANKMSDIFDEVKSSTQKDVQQMKVDSQKYVEKRLFKVLICCCYYKCSLYKCIFANCIHRIATLALHLPTVATVACIKTIPRGEGKES